MTASVRLRAAGAVLLLAALWTFQVPDHPALRLCGFHWLTGRPCPLCGLTRAMFALAKGNVADAVGFNALSPVAFVMLFALFWGNRAPGWLWSGGLAAFAAYGVWRLF